MADDPDIFHEAGGINFTTGIFKLESIPESEMQEVEVFECNESVQNYDDIPWIERDTLVTKD